MRRMFETTRPRTYPSSVLLNSMPNVYVYGDVQLCSRPGAIRIKVTRCSTCMGEVHVNSFASTMPHCEHQQSKQCTCASNSDMNDIGYTPVSAEELLMKLPFVLRDFTKDRPTSPTAPTENQARGKGEGWLILMRAGEAIEASHANPVKLYTLW